MLKIKDLCVTLEDKQLLNNLSLDISAGSIHVIMGPNGSGKSTLAMSLMGHPKYKLTNGEAILDGINLLELPIEKRARTGLFLACQYPQAVPGVEVFTFLHEAHRMLTGQQTSVTDFKNLVYKAFDAVKLDYSFISRNLHEGFSGGEKKRLEIAQLLLFKPKIAILDEIDSGLDIDALKLIAKALNQFKKNNPNASIIIITHYNRFIEYIIPDHVSLLKNGTIIYSADATLAAQIESKGYDGLLL